MHEPFSCTTLAFNAVFSANNSVICLSSRCLDWRAASTSVSARATCACKVASASTRSLRAVATALCTTPKRAGTGVDAS